MTSSKRRRQFLAPRARVGSRTQSRGRENEWGSQQSRGARSSFHPGGYGFDDESSGRSSGEYAPRMASASRTAPAARVAALRSAGLRAYRGEGGGAHGGRDEAAAIAAGYGECAYGGANTAGSDWGDRIAARRAVATAKASTGSDVVRIAYGTATTGGELRSRPVRRVAVAATPAVTARTIGVATLRRSRRYGVEQRHAGLRPLERLVRRRALQSRISRATSARGYYGEGRAHFGGGIRRGALG